MTRLFLAGASATGLIALAAAQAPVAPVKVAPAPPGLITPPTWHQSPSSKGGSGPVIAGPTPTPATSPVKPNPIQPVGATDPLPPPELPTPTATTPVMPAVPTLAPPTIDVPPAVTTFPTPTMTAPKSPPSVSVETTPAPTITAGEPRPLMITGPGSVANPVSPPTSMSGPVPVGNLPNKHAPGVVVETVSPESVSVGQDVTYELVVRNEGSAAVWNVRVEDDVPAGAKYVSSDPVADTANGKLSWSIGSLDAGATKKVKVVVRPTEEGELRNRTVVSFSAATENKMKVTRPRVGVTVSAPDAVKAGDDVAFTVKLQNTGSGPATNLVMRATLSDGLHNANGAVLELKLPTLAAGQTKMVPLRAVATKAGPQACTLAVSADGTIAEPAKAGFTVVEPKLAARVVGPAKCYVRSEPTYTLEFTNPGTATTDPLTATVPLPAGFEFVQASDGGVPSGSGKEIVWRLPGLPAGAGKAVSLKLKAVAPTDANIALRVSAANEAEAPQTGVRPVAMAIRTLETKADLAIRSEGVAALRFEVFDVEDPVEAGKEAIYEIRLTNQGTGPCTNVNITGFPAEGTSPVAANGPTQVRVTTGQLLFDPIAKLDVKGEAIYRVRVRGNQAGDMKFKVQVSCDQIKTPITKEENTRFTKD